jgi:hypothetical protein
MKTRLFLTCWILYGIHFATDFSREHFLVLSIVEEKSFRLNQYIGLHDDIFTMSDGGAHHSGNPGASMIGATPYLVLHRAVETINRYYTAKKPKISVAVDYKDPRPARVRFYKLVQERGWDVKFGLVAAVTMLFCMAPLSAMSTVCMYQLFVNHGLPVQKSLVFSLLYALGTPVLFRTAYLNQNLMVGLFGFFSFYLLTKSKVTDRSLFIAGLLGGLALLCDYSGLIMLLFLAVYAWASQRTLRALLIFVAGSVGPVLLLWFYQWACFGHPFYPPQHHMPAANQWAYAGYQGVTGPDLQLIWMLLFDSNVGLFVVCPLLLLAFANPFLGSQKIFRTASVWFALLLFVAFTLFFSCVQYTRIQWVTGIRYLVPTIPFLFLLLVPVMLRIPRSMAFVLGAIAVLQSWSLAMVRSQQGVVDSVLSILEHGFQLPWLTTLSRMTIPYAPLVQNKSAPLFVFIVTAMVLVAIWRFRPITNPVVERKRDANAQV